MSLAMTQKLQWEEKRTMPYLVVETNQVPPKAGNAAHTEYCRPLITRNSNDKEKRD